mmetsp:Transcript_50644/g.133454  ORF Transcript_50644/g.133454 Transcript_50644/m.133454 type:complete len:159 (+) Transcript_50644:302-778(+)
MGSDDVCSLRVECWEHRFVALKGLGLAVSIGNSSSWVATNSRRLGLMVSANDISASEHVTAESGRGTRRLSLADASAVVSRDRVDTADSGRLLPDIPAEDGLESGRRAGPRSQTDSAMTYPGDASLVALRGRLPVEAGLGIDARKLVEPPGDSRCSTI